MALVKVLSGVAVAVATTAALTSGCEDFTPAKAKAAPTDAGADATVVQEGSAFIPAGALVGEPTTVFGVKVENWGIADANGKVTELSWSMPLTAVAAVPKGTAVDLFFPAKTHPEVGKQLGFQGISYNFLPRGHAPAGVYDVAHWEWHVHFPPSEEFNAIDCTDPKLPPDNMVPSEWFVVTGPGSCIPKAGIHCLWLNTPELNHERFTSSFSTSYYHGLLNAFEPKATVEFLSTRVDFTYKPPDMRFVKDGKLYALAFSGRYDNTNRIDTFILTLSNFQPAE
jgi:hypothetical protein